MALSTVTREWFSKNGLEGFLHVGDAPPHEEPEKVAPTIDLEEITEGTIQALTGLPARGLRSIESPSTEIFYQYFGEYSLSNKAYRTQGREDPLFRKVARVLLEYGFVHSRPPAIPNYRPGFVIAAYEGLKVDWTIIIADCLQSGIASLGEGNNALMGISQWLTLLVTPTACHPTEEAGLTGDDTKESNEQAETLGKAHPGMDSRGLVTTRGSTNQPETRTSRKSTGETG